MSLANLSRTPDRDVDSKHAQFLTSTSRPSDWRLSSWWKT